MIYRITPETSLEKCRQGNVQEVGYIYTAINRICSPLSVLDPFDVRFVDFDRHSSRFIHGCMARCRQWEDGGSGFETYADTEAGRLLQWDLFLSS